MTVQYELECVMEAVAVAFISLVSTWKDQEVYKPVRI
jgi:hypothetical protein